MQHTVCFECASFLRRRCSWQIFFFISLLPVIFLSAFGCEKREAARSQQEQRPVDVAAITVNPKDVPVTYEYIAQVQSSRQVSIQARVNGFLERRVYTEGAIVKEGQILFLMDQKPFKVQLEQAKAALARQQAAFDVARQNLARVKPLAAANALSQKDLDDATGQFQSAAAAVEQAKATVEQAKLNLSYTVITSPVTGITSSAEQADGTYLNPSNSQLTTVTVISPAYVNFSISENDRLRYRDQVAKGLLIEPKDRKYIAEVVLADGSIYPHMGKVTFADPSFNARTGTFLIRSTVENPDGLLRPNQYVRIRLKGALRPNAILVPQRAVQQGSKGHFVWVVDKDDKAELRPVVVGEWHENDWFIYEGLHTGDRVVVDGVLPLRPGTPVKVNTLAEKG
ncbi:MexE family multidrug efflux RND transporter periplasmic adaptor subunit [Desulforhabdus amnigena]|uniref:MexE family multidrug efflux RND transporter periplasmic adaptor subunit n=1 Tax=Desulforhabdus amnigena TaxID=40218 RepID=A0A9W6FTK4_9BACT|nr:MexE family multidrug efflux RND transporter periplasmic adaptor subunit [Desulforhabdus amnigena]